MRGWAAFAWGAGCLAAPAKASGSPLVPAVAAWSSDITPPDPADLLMAGWALGTCASDESEETLTSWLLANTGTLDTALAQSAALGLGALSDHRSSLSEKTQAALVNSAASRQQAELLWPLGRVGRLTDAVSQRLLDVVGPLLEGGSPLGQRAAVFALGRSVPEGAAPLSQVLLSSEFSPEVRAAAAQALAQLGPAGQKALDRAVGDLLKRGLPRSLDHATWIPLWAALSELGNPRLSRAELTGMTALIVPPSADRAQRALRRRMIWLRCAAAELLAGDRSSFPALVSCDPERGRVFQLAQLRVLDRAPLLGSRYAAYQKLAQSEDPLVQQAALRLIASHPEYRAAGKLLVDALRDPVAGTQTTAAQLIAAYPDRIFDAEKRAEAVVEQLSSMLKKEVLPLETRAAALAAAGASGVLTLKPAIEALCDGPHEPLWRPAELALAQLGSPRRRCPQTPPVAVALAEESAPAPPALTLIIDSDVGPLELELDAQDAPVSAAHFLRLVDAGFYDKLTIHGGRAGFAVQFGDKNGDGYEDQASPGLPHEISPAAFTRFSFGMGAFAPGAHNSQIFVVTSDAPQLMGSQVRLGTARGAWNQLMTGDALHSMRRKEE